MLDPIYDRSAGVNKGLRAFMEETLRNYDTLSDERLLLIRGFEHGFDYVVDLLQAKVVDIEHAETERDDNEDGGYQSAHAKTTLLNLVIDEIESGHKEENT